MSLTKDECFQCIAECMVESLPEKWKTAWMVAEVNGNKISATYFYTSGVFRKKSKFKTNNIFAPLNAIKEILEILRSNGNSWTKARFGIRANGAFEFKPVV